MRRNQSRGLTRRALYLAAALLLSYLESLLPPPVAVPGIKWGWGNLAVVLLLLEGDPRGALMVSLTRSALSGLLFAGIQSWLYALPAAMASWAVMAGLGRRFSVVPVSAAGAIAHNLTQLGVAVLAARTPGLASLLPYLATAALVTGVVNGLLARLLARILPPPGGRPIIP